MYREIESGCAVVTVQSQSGNKTVNLVACSKKEKDRYRFYRFESTPASIDKIREIGGIYHKGVFLILNQNSWECSEEEMKMQYRSMFNAGIVIIVSEEELLKQKDGTYLVMKPERRDIGD